MPKVPPTFSNVHALPFFYFPYTCGILEPGKGYWLYDVSLFLNSGVKTVALNNVNLFRCQRCFQHMASAFSFIAMKQTNRHMCMLLKAMPWGNVWLEPKIGIAYLQGFTNSETKNALQIIEANFELFKVKWYEHFSK